MAEKSINYDDYIADTHTRVPYTTLKEDYQHSLPWSSVTHSIMGVPVLMSRWEARFTQGSRVGKWTYYIQEGLKYNRDTQSAQDVIYGMIKRNPPRYLVTLKKGNKTKKVWL